jgi:AcrR family transcriptional regulator
MTHSRPRRRADRPSAPREDTAVPAKTHRPTRYEQKARTRQALLDAALHLMQRHSLASLGLREITRTVGIAPTAFYRHFPDVDSLGVALVEQCLDGLHASIRAVRDGLNGSDEVIHRSIDVLARQVRVYRDHFRFVAREHHGGVDRVREAIADQLDLFSAELAADLAADKLADTPAIDRWRPDDLRMLTDLIVNHMVCTAAALVDAPQDDPAAERQVIDKAGRQLGLILLGARQWPFQPDTAPPAGP